ncbi:SET and MYND domain-containing protein 4 [Liparis tanakae]|uniref:Protein-lysine N-methyltransferase SMYD4 n=1 Tax=Liparis tanakae TaxID=230148 RepID=A0A4Z2G9L1_9TELE|nr:SET and MYND domain-containing protein 4 [Liparis tanakae]
MDLPCVQWQEHVAQKWIGLDPELKETLTSQLDIDELFKCALTLTTQDDLDFGKSISSGYSVQKDAERAAKCRERGNSSFKTRDYTAAALHYSQESLDDIANALKNDYPSHLLHKLEDRRTQCLKRLSVGQTAEEGHHRPASKDHNAPDGAPGATAGLLTFGIRPHASVGFSSEKGRHLVAAEPIAAGEVVLHDRPYSCVLIPGMEEVKGKGGRQDAERALFGVEHRRCHRCLTETLRPVPCEGCSYSRYCSTSCRRHAWEEHHCWECPLGAELKMMGVMSQLALRVALKAGLKNVQMAREPIGDEHTEPEPGGLKGESSDSSPRHSNGTDPCTSYHGDSYASVFHLRHHLNLHSPDVRFQCAVTIATLFLKLSEAGPPPASWDRSKLFRADSRSPDEEDGVADWRSDLWLLGSAVLRHMLQLRCNAQAIVTLQDTGAANSPVQSSREIRIATAIFPTLSLLNHSCRPNTSLVFGTGADLSADGGESVTEEGGPARGVTVTIRASKGLAPGQEILHCYGPHSNRMATQERRRLLQEQYYFLCQCEACTEEEEEEEEEEDEEGSEGRQQWSGVGGRPQSGLLCAKCKGSLKKSSGDGGKGFVCSQASCAHRVSLSEVSRRLQEIRLGLEKAVDLMERERPGDWSNAASHLERSAVAIGSQYGEDSIELSQQLFKLAQLHFNGGARGPALSVIPKVRRLLRLHGGPHCHELRELQAMEDCLQG